MGRSKFDFVLVGTSDFFSISMVKIALEFKKAGYDVAIISGLNVWGDLINDLKHNGIPHLDINKIIKENSVDLVLNDQNVQNYSKVYEDKYGLFSMRDFVFPEKNHYENKTSDLIKKAVSYFYSLEKFFQDVKVKCFIHVQGSEIISRVIYNVGNSTCSRSIFMGESLFKDRMFIYDNPMNLLDNFRLFRYSELSTPEKESVNRYIDDFVERKGVYQYPISDDDVLFSKSRMLRTMNRRYMYWKIRLYLKNIFIYLRNKVYKELFMRYSKFDKAKRYFYFPLNAWADSQITLRSPQYYRQDHLADLIARSLPQDCILYVKEHPGIKVDVPLEPLKSIVKIKNVRLLHPEVNSHSIIENAQGVIVINTTVAFEALLYFKPVIILGNSYLRGHGATIDVHDLYYLRKAIRQSIDNKTNENDIKAFLFSLMRATYEGSIFGAEKVHYNKIVGSFIAKAKELGVVFLK